MAEPSESYEKILTADLHRAIDFLRFAEAKNAAVVAFGSSWFLACLSLECSGKPIPHPFTYCIPIAMAFALCAAGLSLLSFLPRLKLPRYLGGHRTGPHPPNLLYFGDVHTLPIRTLETELRERYYPDANGLRSEYIHDLVVQLHVNSHITMVKMRFFQCGVGSVLIAALVLLVPAIATAIHLVVTK